MTERMEYISQLERKCDDLATKLEAAERDLKKLQMLFSLGQQELDSASEAVALRESQMEDADAEIAELEHDYQRDTSNLRAQLADLTAENARLREVMNRVRRNESHWREGEGHEDICPLCILNAALAPEAARVSE